MGEEQGLVRAEGTLSLSDVKGQINLIRQIMKDVMKNGQHYGKIPGCGDKPTLLKPGAEKLSLTFRLRPVIDNNNDVSFTDLGNGHREIRVYCHIMSMSGVELATGVGSCSTMETKYRYRGGEKKPTENPVPKEYWNLKKDGKFKDAQDLIGGRGFGVAKIDGDWLICEIGEKMDNPDIADTYNTVLKMAKKRAYIDGILSATAASDIFTQDLEDTHDIPVVETVAEVNAAEPADNSEPLISDKQGKMLYAKWKEKGIPDEDVKKYLKGTFRIEHTRDIQAVWFDDVLAWVKNWVKE